MLNYGFGPGIISPVLHISHQEQYVGSECANLSDEKRIKLYKYINVWNMVEYV